MQAIYIYICNHIAAICGDVLHIYRYAILSIDISVCDIDIDIAYHNNYC